MKLLASSFVALALLTGAVRPAAAQLGARSIEVQPFVGSLSFDDDVALDNTLGFGGRLAYNFTDTWALEGTLNYTPNAESDRDRDLDRLDLDRLSETSLLLAHGNLNYNILLNNSRLVPFLTAGGGLARFDVDDGPLGGSSTDGEVNAGGGFKLFLTETVAARGDIRNHWIFTSVPNRDPDEPGDEADAETTSNLELSAGVSFNF